MRRGLAIVVVVLALAACGDQGSTGPTTRPAQEQPRQSSTTRPTPPSPLPTPSYRELPPSPEPTPSSTALTTAELSAGVLALVTDCDEGTRTPLECTRWGLTLLGDLGDDVPAVYTRGRVGANEVFALTLLVYSYPLTAEEEASLQADIDAFGKG